jgi:hypothetical protein
MIHTLVQLPGNRHDVNGLYTLLQTSFTGHLLGDNAYTPTPHKRAELAAHGIQVTAQARSNAKQQLSPRQRRFVHKWRSKIERRIALFNRQFHADRTLCRSYKHYCARRSAKALAHNTSRVVNDRHHCSRESLAHFHLAA